MTETTADAVMTEINDEECRQALGGLPAPVMTIDRDFNVTYLNPAGESLLSLSPGSAKGRKCYELFNTLHCRTPECRCAQAMESGQSTAGETILDPEGLQMAIQYHAAPITDESGKIVGATEFVLDINEASVNQSTLAGIPTPVMAIDKEFNVVYLNDVGEKLVGLEPGAAKGRKCYDLFKTPHCQTPECRCIQAMSSGEARTGDTVADPDGLNIPIRYTGSPLRDLSGAMIGAVEYVVDIGNEFKIADAISALSTEIVAGNLDQRADTKHFSGSYKTLLEHANTLVDAFDKPLAGLMPVLENLSSGDLTARVTGEYSGTYDRLKQATNRMGEQFHAAMTKIGDSSALLASSAEELSAVATQMTKASEETFSRASTVSAASEEVSESVQTVSSATEEMNASIQEISKNATVAVEVANSAVKAADASMISMDQLDRSSTEIGQVVKLITSVAQQTNLLALNATIEAARAGEAGKGFAVVANEVKELAKQTAQATEEISQKIEAIQKTTGNSIEEISGIAKIIRRIDDIQQTISAAVEEQTATTSEISRSISEVARGGAEIGNTMADLTDAASAASQSTKDTLGAASSLSQMAADLSALVQQFKI